MRSIPFSPFFALARNYLCGMPSRMFDRYWRNRAERAEAKLAEAQATIVRAKEELNGMEQRAALVSIVRDKRTAKFLFVRNGELTQVHTYITLEQDWAEIERRLIR